MINRLELSPQIASVERAEPLDFGDTHLDNMAAVQVESRLRLIAPSNCPFFFILAFGIHSLLLLRPPIIDAKLHPPVSTTLETRERSAGLEFDHFFANSFPHF